MTMPSDGAWMPEGDPAQKQETEFRTMYLGMPSWPDEREQWLLDLARQYHERCDAYDAQVCTYKDEKGEPRPVGDECGLVLRFAVRTERELWQQAQTRGYGWEQWRDAKRKEREIRRGEKQ